MSFVGHGGSSLLIRSLYQTLNYYFRQVGPGLDPNRPLQQHIHLEEFAVVVHCNNEDTSSGISFLANSPLLDGLVGFVKMMGTYGPLSGFVDVVKTRGSDIGEIDKTLIDEGVSGKVPESGSVMDSDGGCQ